MKAITGQNLNIILELNAEHALYSQSGEWYHHLKKFPGVLFDQKGFLYFKTKDDYEKDKSLQHGKDLNIDGGISSITGYKYFTQSENEKINSLVNKTELIEESKAWSIFLQNAKKYEDLKEIFISPSEHRRYQIISTQRNVVKISRLDTPNSEETISRIKFITCINRINGKKFPIKKGSIYEHVAEEVAIVELLPDLDWNEKGNNIISASNNLNRNEVEISEAKNDNIKYKELVAIKIRRGQKNSEKNYFIIMKGSVQLQIAV